MQLGFGRWGAGVVEDMGVIEAHCAPGTSALDAEDKPRVLSGTRPGSRERDGRVHVQVQEVTWMLVGACGGSSASQLVVRVPGQSGTDILCSFCKGLWV